MAGGHRCGRSIRLPQAAARPSEWSHGITGLARPCPTHPFHMRSGGGQAHPSSAQALASSGGGQLTTGPLSPARPPSARKQERDWCPAMGSASAGLQHHRSAARGVRGGRSVLDLLALCGGLTGADRRSRKRPLTARGRHRRIDLFARRFVVGRVGIARSAWKELRIFWRSQAAAERES